jgi:glycosyltransferase involved in cell wall biosynthesis
LANVVFAIPGDIALRTGGYIYDRRVLALLPSAGVAARHLPLAAGYPFPSRDELAATARAFSQLPRDAVLMVDGLAYGAMPPEVIAQAPCPVVALVHHPLCLETGLPAQRSAALRASEAAALALARHVIVTSPTTARTLMAEFCIGPERVTVAVPGTDKAPLARPPRTPGPPADGRRALARLHSGRARRGLRLLAAGSIVPRKGYDILVRALARLRHLDWCLTIAGDRGFSPATTAALEARIRYAGLRDRVRLVGAVDRRTLAKLYAGADVFATASLYEGYGMVLGEALAHGLPVVASTGGAAAETVPDGAALKVPPGDARALARALGRVLQSAQLRSRLGAAARAAGRKLPDWQDTAGIVAGVIGDIAHGRSHGRG